MSEYKVPARTYTYIDYVAAYNSRKENSTHHNDLKEAADAKEAALRKFFLPSKSDEPDDNETPDDVIRYHSRLAEDNLRANSEGDYRTRRAAEQAVSLHGIDFVFRSCADQLDSVHWPFSCFMGGCPDQLVAISDLDEDNVGETRLAYERALKDLQHRLYRTLLPDLVGLEVTSAQLLEAGYDDSVPEPDFYDYW
jgi:hypothetical protein